MIALNNIKKGIPSGILMKNIYFSFFLFFCLVIEAE